MIQRQILYSTVQYSTVYRRKNQGLGFSRSKNHTVLRPVLYNAAGAMCCQNPRVTHYQNGRYSTTVQYSPSNFQLPTSKYCTKIRTVQYSTVQCLLMEYRHPGVLRTEHTRTWNENPAGLPSISNPDSQTASLTPNRSMPFILYSK